MDIKHNYIEKGEGEALILLHGNSGSLETFSPQIDEFSQHYRVIALDTRGHGETPRGEEAFTIRQFADDLNAFMDEMKIEKANILGFSDGGNIALCFAIKYPERVLKLVVGGANLVPGGITPVYRLPITAAYHFTKHLKKAKADNEMLGLMVNDPNIDVKELEKIKCPVLVIAGTRDLIKRKHTELIAGSITKSSLAFIEGSHSVNRENPKEYNKMVLGFLKSKY